MEGDPVSCARHRCGLMNVITLCILAVFGSWSLEGERPSHLTPLREVRVHRTGRFNYIPRPVVLVLVRERNREMSFLRVKLIEVNFGEGGAMPADPFCAVKILEVQSQNEDGEHQLVQKKKTFYPQWNRCFDSHLVQGRRMQVIVMDKQVGRLCAVGRERGRPFSFFLPHPVNMLSPSFSPAHTGRRQ